MLKVILGNTAAPPSGRDSPTTGMRPTAIDTIIDMWSGVLWLCECGARSSPAEVFVILLSGRGSPTTDRGATAIDIAIDC